jgi:hypothetical protein
MGVGDASDSCQDWVRVPDCISCRGLPVVCRESPAIGLPGGFVLRSWEILAALVKN